MYNIYFGRPRYCSLFFFQIGKKPTDGAEAISSQQPGSQSHHHPEGSDPHPTSQLCSAQLCSTPDPVWIRYQLEDYDWKEEREEKWKKSFTNYKESKTLLNLPIFLAGVGAVKCSEELGFLWGIEAFKRDLPHQWTTVEQEQL